VGGGSNALCALGGGDRGFVGRVAAGPLMGAARAALWAVLVVGGCLVASLLALGLYRRLTPAQDGRPAETPALATQRA